MSVPAVVVKTAILAALALTIGAPALRWVVARAYRLIVAAGPIGGALSLRFLR